MKLYFQAFVMCQSMFCAFPWPWPVWEEKAREKMLPFLPLVGLEIGAVWAILAWLVSVLHLPGLMAALVVAAYPYFATGFIHLDGFMDVTDAVKSCRSLERRREILKDSHVGSFAVIGLALLLLAQFASAASLPDRNHTVFLLLLPMVSRCGSLLAVTALPPMNTSQYAGQNLPGSHIAAGIGLLGVALCAGFRAGVPTGLGLVGCALGYALALRWAYRSLEGMNGDIAGYALTMGELVGLAVYALL